MCLQPSQHPKSEYHLSDEATEIIAYKMELSTAVDCEAPIAGLCEEDA